MRGAMGLSLDTLNSTHLDYLQKRLTLSTRPFKDEAPQVVQSFVIRDGYFWVPRYFDHLSFWPRIQPAGWQWVAPFLDYTLQSKFTPDATRQQPQGMDALEAHLKKHSGCIGVLPTGTGKTFMSLEVARRFNTPIAVLIHKGDMEDNWIEHASDHLGVPPQDVGIVREGRIDMGKPVTICSIQTLLSRDMPEGFYEQFGFVIADEVHHYGAGVWSRVVSNFPARYRLGVSANPVRDDGLDPVVRWNFGKVGFGIYKRRAGQLPLACLIRYAPGQYGKRSYHDWKRLDGRWVMGSPNALKYAKCLAADESRNSWLVGKLIEARAKGRRVLIFSKLRDHIKALHDEFVARWTQAMLDAGKDPGNTRCALLWGGLKKRERKAAMTADMTFTTYGFSREATNLPHKDTLALATPAEDALQTAGRLRDKGDPDRKSFLIIDPFESNDYSYKKAQQRVRAYNDLGIKISRFTVGS